MNKSRSIKQNVRPDALPNFRNLGVTLRILLISNGLALLQAILLAGAWRDRRSAQAPAPQGFVVRGQLPVVEPGDMFAVRLRDAIDAHCEQQFGFAAVARFSI